MSVSIEDTEKQEDKPTYGPMASVKEFHKAFSVVPYVEQPDAWGRKHLLQTRLTLITEEFREVQDELLDAINGSGDWMNLAKELADLLYVTYGTAEALDIPLERVFNAVHKSNMSKLDKHGKPIFRHDGKVLKSDQYQAPDLTTIFGVSD